MRIYFIIATAGITVITNRYGKNENITPEDNVIKKAYQDYLFSFARSDDYKKFEEILDSGAPGDNLKKSLSECKRHQIEEYAKFSKSQNETNSILPLEITSVCNFVEALPDYIKFTKHNRDDLKDIELNICLISTDTFLCAAACHILKDFLMVTEPFLIETLKKIDIIKKIGSNIKMVIDEEIYVVNGLKNSSEDCEDSSVNSLFTTLGKIKQKINKAKGVKYEYMLIAGIRAMVPHLTIYAQIANKIPLIISPKNTYTFKIEALPASFDDELVEKYHYYLQKIKEGLTKGQPYIPPNEVTNELLKYHLIDDKINITGMGALFERDFKNNLTGHIYANTTALWLATEHREGHSSVGDAIKTGIKYEIHESNPTNIENGEADILILQKSENALIFDKGVLCECKTVYNALSMNKDNSELKLNQQIRRYAKLAAEINGGAGKYTLKSDIYDFNELKAISEFRIYVYAPKKDDLIEELRGIIEQLKSVWKDVYYAYSARPTKKLDEVGFSVYHIITYETIQAFFDTPLEIIPLTI